MIYRVGNTKTAALKTGSKLVWADVEDEPVDEDESERASRITKNAWLYGAPETNRFSSFEDFAKHSMQTKWYNTKFATGYESKNPVPTTSSSTSSASEKRAVDIPAVLVEGEEFVDDVAAAKWLVSLDEVDLAAV